MKYEAKLRALDILRVRRLALGAMISKGGVPRPAQFARAGLPPLYRASELPTSAEDSEQEAPTEARELADNKRRGVGHPQF